MVARRRFGDTGTNSAFALVVCVVLAATLLCVDLRYGASGRQVADDWGLAVTVLLSSLAALVALRDRRRATALARAVGSERTRAPDAELELELAVERERARIAGDLHDTVAHAVSVMVLQSLAGRSVLQSDPEAAGRMIDGVAQSGQLALEELRRLLGALESPGTSASSDAEAAGLARLGDLVDRACAAGLPSTLVFRASVELSPEVQTTVYRVVQESLTNALRYATGARTCVTVGTTDERVVITVENEPAGGRAFGYGAGRGLRVMGHRVAAHHGAMSAGPTPAGGWRVQVVLPLREPAADLGRGRRRHEAA